MLYNGNPTMAVMPLKVAEATTSDGRSRSRNINEHTKGKKVFYRHNRTSFHHTKLIELRVCSVDGIKPYHLKNVCKLFVTYTHTHIPTKSSENPFSSLTAASPSPSRCAIEMALNEKKYELECDQRIVSTGQ